MLRLCASIPGALQWLPKPLPSQPFNMQAFEFWAEGFSLLQTPWGALAVPVPAWAGPNSQKALNNQLRIDGGESHIRPSQELSRSANNLKSFLRHCEFWAATVFWKAFISCLSLTERQPARFPPNDKAGAFLESSLSITGSEGQVSRPDRKHH